MSELDPLIEALRAAKSGSGEVVTRLATVVGGTATTVTVRFDGESVDSPRAYVKTFQGAAVGDRAVMLRVGSTWVAIARVSAAPVSLPRGPTPNSNGTGGDTYWVRAGNVISLRVWNDVGATAVTNGMVATTVPFEAWPVFPTYFTVADVASGNPVQMFLNTNGVLGYVHTRQNQSVLGNVTYITANGGV